MAMIFQKRSTRTRTSSEGGFALLGGHAVALSPTGMHLGFNESIKDTARFQPRFQEKDKMQGRMAWKYHEHYQSINGMTMTWVGDGNNIIHSLMMVAPRLGVNMRIATPKGYEVLPEVAKAASEFANQCSTRIEYTNDPYEACKDTNIIVTDAWISIGQDQETPEKKVKRLKSFAGYQVNKKMTSLAADNWCLLHRLPRKSEEEVDDETFYSKNSLVFQEAENRKWTVMSVMLNLLKDYEPTMNRPNF